VSAQPTTGAGTQPDILTEAEAGNLSSRRPRGLRSWALRAGSVVIVLVAWQLFAYQLDPILLPTPLAVAQAMLNELTTGSLLRAAWVSLVDVALGFGLALAVGILVGILMGRYRAIEEMLDPFVSFFNATPMVALVPVVIIWFGLSLWSRVFFVFILAVWSILVNTVEGIKNVNKGLMEVGVSFGLSEASIVRSISIPGAVPYMLAGVRVGLGKAIIGMIIGEYSIALAGLGGLAVSYGDAFQTARLLGVIVYTSLFGVLAVAILQLIQRRFFPWISGISGGRR
jgi:ABC-type nitrate/sulfonate/bicarbonate transport system permease component